MWLNVGRCVRSGHPADPLGELRREAAMGHKRTNIDIDEGLVAEAMQRYGTRTMRETVDLALRRLVGEPMSATDALALRGTGWEGDLEQMRAGWDATAGSATSVTPDTTSDTPDTPDERGGTRE
jgi:Arc/MetJ family transcription regulator